jgi:hypothetical protein
VFVLLVVAHDAHLALGRPGVQLPQVVDDDGNERLFEKNEIK